MIYLPESSSTFSRYIQTEPTNAHIIRYYDIISLKYLPYPYLNLKYQEEPATLYVAKTPGDPYHFLYGAKIDCDIDDVNHWIKINTTE